VLSSAATLEKADAKFVGVACTSVKIKSLTEVSFHLK
jgi:hypothetical protein